LLESGLLFPGGALAVPSSLRKCRCESEKRGEGDEVVHLYDRRYGLLGCTAQESECKKVLRWTSRKRIEKRGRVARETERCGGKLWGRRKDINILPRTLFQIFRLPSKHRLVAKASSELHLADLSLL
jgi:hypothetical protein